jgi:hypothetical protein
MSVDVFGRQLEKSTAVSSRGPPGVGFKITADGHYDIDNKRLCSVANPIQQNDAVTVSYMQQEIDVLLNKIHNNNSMIHALESRMTQALQNLGVNIETAQDLPIRNSKVIYELDARLKVLEDERVKASAREGTT